jgi:hypothetical protein
VEKGGRVFRVTRADAVNAVLVERWKARRDTDYSDLNPLANGLDATGASVCGEESPSSSAVRKKRKRKRSRAG